jgi:hypothetical protein
MGASAQVKRAKKQQQKREVPQYEAQGENFLVCHL